MLNCSEREQPKKGDVYKRQLIYCEKDCDAAAVYTQNLVCGAPITVTRENISDGKARASVCNSGIANTCKADGVEKAEEMCKITADALGISKSEIVAVSYTHLFSAGAVIIALTAGLITRGVKKSKAKKALKNNQK